jgi:hypothetical protein
MGKVSSVTTGTATVSAAALAPIVLWGIHGFPVAQMPDSAPLLIAAGLITGGHAAYNIITGLLDSRAAKKS